MTALRKYRFPLLGITVALGLGILLTHFNSRAQASPYQTGTEVAPSQSATGGQIAFIRGGRSTSTGIIDDAVQLYAMNPDGSGIHLMPVGSGIGSPSWSPDRKRIAYIKFEDGDGHVFVADADGKNQHELPVTPPSSGASPAWSPDGKQIVYTVGVAGGNLVVANPDGSNSHFLYFGKHSYGYITPSWSPDSKNLIYSVNGIGIVIANIDGNGGERVLNYDTSAFSPRWSPDGTQIVYVSKTSGNKQIFVMNADGSNPHNITNNKDDDSSPHWSPDGKFIVYTASQTESSQIYIMDADGSNPHNISNSKMYDQSPDWGPMNAGLQTIATEAATPAVEATYSADDDTAARLAPCLAAPQADPAGTIAFVRGGRDITNIYLVNPDGSNLTQLTKKRNENLSPSWSPDGHLLAFSTSSIGKGPQIEIIKADGSQECSLTLTGNRDTEPSWSPDGKQIAFTSMPDGKPQIYVINADGTNQHNISNEGSEDKAPHWSPDSKRISFIHDGQIYIMNADGTGKVAVPFQLADHNQIRSAVWSPDGNYLVVGFLKAFQSRIAVIKIDGSDAHDLVTDKEGYFNPSWSPDGRQIIFAFTSSPLQIYLMNPDGTNLHPLFNSDSIDDQPTWLPSH